MSDIFIKSLTIGTLKKSFRKIKKITKNFTNLMVRDPLDFVDYEFKLNENLYSLLFKIKNGQYRCTSPYLHESAKSGGITRHTVILSIEDMIIYQLCVDQIEDVLILKTEKNRTKNDFIRGGLSYKKRIKNSEEDYYEVWYKDWVGHLNKIKTEVLECGFVATTDIANYFDTINLLILKEMIRSDVHKKYEIINLLIYCLENIKIKKKYEANIGLGLPQENIDCSRLLAYYFLNEHDDRMLEYSIRTKSLYFRYADDMNIVVRSYSEGRNAIKIVSNSLKELHLNINAKKTSVVSAEEYLYNIMLEENLKIDNLLNEIYLNIENKNNLETIEYKVIDEFYSFLQHEGKKSSWLKLLKRYFTVFSLLKSNKLLDYFEDWIIKYPVLFQDGKICKYIVSLNQKSQNKFIIFIVKYLISNENLYPAVESNLLELVLSLDNNILYTFVRLKLDDFTTNYYYVTQNEYTKCLLTLFYFKNINVVGLANIYNIFKSEYFNDSLLNRYISLVLLCHDDLSIRNFVRSKINDNSFVSFNRLKNIIDLDKVKLSFEDLIILNFLKERPIYILFLPKSESPTKSKIEIKYNIYEPRKELLKKILSIDQ